MNDDISPPLPRFPMLASLVRYRYAAFGIVVAAGLAFGVAGRGGHATGNASTVPEEAAPLPVHATRIDAIMMDPLTVTYPGVVIAKKESNLGFERPGRVTRVLKEEGDRVTAFELIAELDTEDLDASEERANAELRSADAILQELIAGPREQEIRAAQARVEQRSVEIKLAKTNLEREQTLSEKGAGSQRALDDAKYALQVLEEQIRSSTADLELLQEGTRSEQIAAQRARCESIRAQLKEIEAQRSDSKILAPYDGHVTTRLFDEGAVITAGTPVIGMISHELEARFGLPVAIASKLSVGQTLEIAVGESRRVATVARLEPNVDMATRTRGVYLRLRQSGSEQDRQTDETTDWIAGQVASVLLPATISSGVDAQRDPDEHWVPTSALTSAGRGIWSLLVVTRDSAESPISVGAVGTCELRAVEVVRTEGQHSLVRGMVRGNDWLITDGLHRLTAGMKVKIAESESS